MSASKRKISLEQGVSFTELLIILPFLIIVITGIIEYGIGLRNMEHLTASARHAARYSAARAGNTGLLCTHPGADINTLNCTDTLALSPISSDLSVQYYAKWAACDSINRSAGMSMDDWNVNVTIPSTAGAPDLLDSVATPSGQIVRVNVSYGASARFCILCVGNFRFLDAVGLTGSSVGSTSAFALEGTCS